jgi:uncharacterized membrane protein (DUF106 family)
MIYLSDLILQIPGFAPTYTKHPIFPDLFSSLIIAGLIAVGLNFAFALLRKKTTDIDRLSKVMKETNEWRKEYTDAIRKQDKVRISELNFHLFLVQPLLFLHFTFHMLCVQMIM